MRVPPRKSRSFRPLALALESICPVSSLATTLPPPPLQIGEGPVDAEQTPVFIRTDAPGTARSVIANRTAIRQSGTPHIGNAALAAQAKSESRVGFAANSLTTIASLPAANLITIVGAGNNCYSNSPGRPAESTGGGAYDSGLSAGQTGGNESKAAQPPVGIRPMTLAANRTPAGPGDGHADAMSAASGSGSGTGSDGGGGTGSGSGSNPTEPPPKPYLRISGGGNGGGGDSKDFTIPTGLPIGTIASVGVTAASGYQIESVTWTGLDSTYYSYYMGAADADQFQTPPYMAPQPVSLSQSQTSVTFLVDPRKGSYSVGADVKYVGNSQRVKVTGTFQVIAPTGALKILSDLPANEAITQTGFNGAQYAKPDGEYPNDGGIRFEAKTSIPMRPAAMPGEMPTGFGGSFMILQTVDPKRYYTNTENRNFWIEPDYAVPDAMEYYPFGNTYYVIDRSSSTNLDNYSGKIGAAVEAIVGDRPAINGVQAYSWSQAYNDPVAIYTTNDTPSSVFPMDAKSWEIRSETLNTYLMYMPSGGGVWTAISKVQWGWSITSSAPDWLPTDRANPASVVGVSDPWPFWVGLISNVNMSNWTEL